MIVFSLFIGMFFMVQPVVAQEYAASPSAQPLVSPTVLPDPVCEELRVVKGSGAIAPETVGFETVTRNQIPGTSYRYHFGDGTVKEGGSTIEHRYVSGGTYTAYVEVKDSQGKWQTSERCKATVVLNQPPLISGRVACGSVMILEGNETVAPADVSIAVNGSGNVSEIASYRVDFGDGKVEEGASGTFVHQYSSPGTYQIKGYVKDSLGVMYGGTEGCVKTVKVLAAAPLTMQPETGVPLSAWIMIVGMAATAMTLRMWAYATRRG
jgi:hypothetical protein